MLVGLLALFFVLHTMKKQQELEEAKEQAEKELQATGLEKGDLKTNRARAIIELQRHPKQARRMQKIVENAVLLEAI